MALFNETRLDDGRSSRKQTGLPHNVELARDRL